MSVATLQKAVMPEDGVFVRREARGHDVSNYRLRVLEASEIIRKLHPETWQFTAVPATQRSAVRAAVKAAGGLAYASHASAAFLLGLEDNLRGRPEITLRCSVAPTLNGVRVHRSRSLPAEDVTTVTGIATTAGHRTVVDLGTRVEQNERIELADRAICAQVTSRPLLLECARRLQSGRAGVATFVRITEPGADGVFWSALERLFGQQVRHHALPAPLFNAPLRHRGDLFYVDALWPVESLAVELRGLAFHRTREHRIRDDLRSNVMSECGLRSLVFGWRDVRDDFRTVAATIRRTLCA